MAFYSLYCRGEPTEKFYCSTWCSVTEIVWLMCIPVNNSAIMRKHLRVFACDYVHVYEMNLEKGSAGEKFIRSQQPRDRIKATDNSLWCSLLGGG